MIKRGRPWDRIPNATVAQLVKEGKRPTLPAGFLSIVRLNHGYMLDIMELAWSQQPETRPDFTEIVKRFDRQRPELADKRKAVNGICP